MQDRSGTNTHAHNRCRIPNGREITLSSNYSKSLMILLNVVFVERVLIILNNQINQLNHCNEVVTRPISHRYSVNGRHRINKDFKKCKFQFFFLCC